MPMSKHKKLISFIFPIYNEEDNIVLLHSTMQQIVAKVKNDYQFEYIFVNDGSNDKSFEELLKIREQDPKVNIINFSRNFGHQIAVTAGLDYASGDAVIIMDADMQDPPKVCLELIIKWREGYDVVYAQRRSRKDTKFKKYTAAAYYRLLARLADINIPRDTGDFRLMDRKVVNEIIKFREKNRYIRGLVSYVGFKQTAVLFDRDKRHSGVTGYSIKKMIKFAMDGILGFSTVPLKLISQFGLIISAMSFLGITYVLAIKVFFPEQVIEGWTLIIISVLFIGGIQLIMLGILGSYIGRIYTESQSRPLYIVDSFIGKSAKE